MAKIERKRMEGIEERIAQVCRGSKAVGTENGRRKIGGILSLGEDGREFMREQIPRSALGRGCGCHERSIRGMGEEGAGSRLYA